MARAVGLGIAAGFMVVFFALTAGVALYALDIFARPAQPLDLGELQRIYETEFTVLRVDRAKTVAFGRRVRRAHGTFYIVEAVVYCPFGERYHWSDDRVEVRTFSGSGGSNDGPGWTSGGRRFAVDAAAQRLLDAQDGRPGPRHVVRGASQHERLVFDLPNDVEQPGLVFLDANDPWNALDPIGPILGQIWEPHRFNLRYD